MKNKMDSDKQETNDLRMEGKLIGILKKGDDKYSLEITPPGLDLPKTLWVNSPDGPPKSKYGKELEIDDYIISSYVNSKPYTSHGKETTSRWSKGGIEVVDPQLLKGKPQPPADKNEIKPANEDGPREQRKHQAGIVIQDSLEVFEKQFDRQPNSAGDYELLAAVFRYLAWSK